MLWYLAHPVAPDEAHTYEENMDDARRWWVLLMRNNITVCAPWFGLCHALDDAKPDDRALGMKIDQAVLARCDGIIATGHRISSGMQKEIDAMEARQGTVVDLVGETITSLMQIDDVVTKILLAQAGSGPPPGPA